MKPSSVSGDACDEREGIQKLTSVLPADRQVQIVELDGLQLLLPLTKSKDTEVQRLAAHALANLSVNCNYPSRFARRVSYSIHADI
jgi:hypothetical protein